MKKVWAVTLAAALAVMHPVVEAKRMGGGSSVGKQSSNVTQRQSAPPVTPAKPVQQQQPAQQNVAGAARPATAAAAAPARKPWGAMLGGLAAGLGLAWLAHSLGFGEAFANMLLFGLLALVIMAVIGMVLRRRANKQSVAASPLAFQGAGANVSPGSPAQFDAPHSYNPEKVGNDASARPWEQVPAAGGLIGAGIGATQTNWSVPADFDTNIFLEAAKRNFVALQAAWDRADIATLRSMMTDEMLAEIRNQLNEREVENGSGPNQTDVVMLQAQLLGIEDLGDAYMASVEFSGLIREEPSAGPNPFREVWNMTKPKDNASGWLVAGLQVLG